MPKAPTPHNSKRPSPLEQFQWAVQPAAEQMVQDVLEDVVARSPFAAELRRRMRDETGTRLFYWVDYLVVPDAGGLRERLRNAGFIGRFATGAGEYFVHEEGIFPAVVPSHGGVTWVFLKVESVADFLSIAQGANDATVEGAPLSPVRRCRISDENDVEVWVIERHGYRGFNVPSIPAEKALAVLKHQEVFRRRRRDFADEADGFAHAHSLIAAAIADLGVDRACELFFAAE